MPATAVKTPLRPRLRRTVALLRHSLLWCRWVFFDIQANQLRLHTAGLVYMTLLSFIPMMAVVFALLKSFEAHLWIEPFLFQYLAPLGPGKSLQITEQIMAFITNTRVGVLGAVSLTVLLFATVKLATQVEEAFNTIWRVFKPRSWWQRTRDALGLLTLGPVLIAAALGASAAAKDWGPLKVIFDLPMIQGVQAQALAGLPYVFTLSLLWLLYMWAPNTRIKPWSALVGAVVALVGWKVLAKIFTLFIAGSGQYEAIYSGFAAAILFVMWLYLSWLVLLLGAQVAYWVQYRHHINDQPTPFLNAAQRLQLGLQAASLIAQRHNQGKPPLTLDDLTRELHLSPTLAHDLLLPLLNSSLVTLNAQGGILPNQATHRVPLGKLLAALQGAPLNQPKHLNQLCHKLLLAQQQAAGRKTWADLAR